MSDPNPTADESQEPKPTDWSSLPSMYAKRRESRAAREGACPTIGSLTETIASSPKDLASALGSLPSNSAITGTPSRALAVPKPTGRQLGAIGAAELQTVEQAWQARDADALESSLYRSLKPLATSLRPLTDASHDLTGYERVGPIPDGTLTTLRDMAKRITAPAGPQAATKSVSLCLMATKSREPDGVDLRGMIALLAEDLAEFPPDVIATACRKWAWQEKWWPSLSEIRERCHRANRWRKSFAKAVAA